ADLLKQQKRRLGATGLRGIRARNRALLLFLRKNGQRDDERQQDEGHPGQQAAIALFNLHRHPSFSSWPRISSKSDAAALPKPYQTSSSFRVRAASAGYGAARLPIRRRYSRGVRARFGFHAPCSSR